MYVGMAKSIKDGRLDIRIAKALKADAEIVAAMRYQDLTELVTRLLEAEVTSVIRNNKAGFDDAAARLATVAVVKSNVSDQNAKRSPRIPKDSARRAASGGRKR